MQNLIETLNLAGARAIDFAWPMLWQSSLLIALVFIVDWAFRRRVRAAVRYALWGVVLVKLLLPPSLALPTGLSWWLTQGQGTKMPKNQAAVVVSYGPASAPVVVVGNAGFNVASPPERLSLSGAALLSVGGISLGLLLWIAIRWIQVAKVVRRATGPPAWLKELADRDRRALRLSQSPRLRLVEDTVSPAVCGLFRPVVLLPKLIVERLTAGQLRVVLLHELVHLRRFDVWVNCAQALIQVFYWWHPLVWLANGRIRRVREEAVDDAVVVALRDEAETYAPTLLEVARLALRPPLVTLGLVGILESRSFLRQRIERLLEAKPGHNSGLSIASVLCVLAFGALAVPMGQGPERNSGNPEARVEEFAPLMNRVFQVDGSLGADLRRTTGHPGVANTNATAEVLRDFCARMGVDLTPPKSSFINEAAGVLFIRATARDLVLIDQALRQLSLVPPTTEAPPTASEAKAASLVAEAKELHEQGKFDEVEVKSRQALKENPQSQAAYYYLNLAAEAKRSGARATAKPGAPPEPSRQSVTNDPRQLYTRIFKVDPNTFVSNLEAVLETKHESGANMLLDDVRKFFATVGVELTPPKSIFFNERGGTLLVRSTLQDLDTIETIVQTLNIAPPQINVKATFLHLPEEEVDEFAKSIGMAETLSTNMVALLGPAQVRKAQEILKDKEKATLMNQVSATTLSGRQAQIAVQEMQTIVKDINPMAFQPPGVAEDSQGTNGLYRTETVALGPTLDLIAYVAADGCTIQLTAIVALTEFLGYQTSTNTAEVYVDGKRQTAKTPLPMSRRRSMTHSAIIRDGQTVLLGRAPVSDSPALGGKKTHLFVLLTPTIIDPAGNRVHPELDQAPAPRR